MSAHASVTRRAAFALALAALGACGGADDARVAPPTDDGPALVVDTVPRLVLDDDGTPERLFAGISARRLPSGGIVVADRGSSELRLFAPNGRFVRRLARKGDGPGELRGELTLSSYGDSALTFGLPPLSAPDVNVLPADGGPPRRFRPTAANVPLLTVVARLSDDVWVVHRGGAFRALARAPELGVLHADSVTYGLVRLNGDGRADSVVWLPPVVRRWSHAYPMPPGLSPIPTGTHDFAFQGAVHAAASDGRFWLVDGQSGRLRALDGTGRELLDRQLDLPAQPFDDAALRRLGAAQLRAAGSARDSARIEAGHDARLRPRTAPLVSAAFAGDDGELWLRLWDADASAPQRLLLLDSSGAEVGRATVPAELDVQQIGRDFVLAIRRDSLGLESVQEHALRRP